MSDAEKDAEERPDATPGGSSEDKVDDLAPAEGKAVRLGALFESPWRYS